MLELLKTLFYEPIYNILILFINVVPGHNVGLSILLTTVLVKALIFPLSHKASRTQLKMREIEPEVEELRKKNPDKQQQAALLLDLYKKHKINPFTGFGIFLIQIPIIISLYLIFLKSGLPLINAELLYSFIPSPETVGMVFLGVDMAGKSIILAIFAGVTQFIQAYLIMPKNGPLSNNPSFREEFTRSMNIQMKYVFPLIVGFIAYQFSAAVALYWVVGNIFTIGQELFTKFSMKRQ